MRGQVLKGHLDLLLLAVLEAGPAHGYAVIERLRDRSLGAFDLPEGTIYPALHRLERAGYLSSRWEEAAGRRRRVYRLTRPGHDVLRTEKRSWDSFSSAVRAVLEVET